MEIVPLPNKKSAEKRVLITERNRVRNNGYKSAVRTAIKKVLHLLEVKPEAKNAVPVSPADVIAAISAAQSLIDRAVLKGIFPINKGSRDKARLARALNRSQQTAS